MTNKYIERSLYTIIFLIIITLLQLILVLTGSKFLFTIIIESIVLGVFIILFVVSLTDYIKKDDVEIKGKIIEISNNAFTYEKENGKIKHIKIDLKKEKNNYLINDEIIIIESRRAEIYKGIIKNGGNRNN